MPRNKRRSKDTLFSYTRQEKERDSVTQQCWGNLKIWWMCKTIHVWSHFYETLKNTNQFILMKSRWVLAWVWQELFGRGTKTFLGDGKSLIMHGLGRWLHKSIHLSKLSNCSLKMCAFYCVSYTSIRFIFKWFLRQPCKVSWVGLWSDSIYRWTGQTLSPWNKLYKQEGLGRFFGW